MVQAVELHREVTRIQHDGTPRTTTGYRRTLEVRPGDGVLTVHTQHNFKCELERYETYVEIVSQSLQETLHKVFEGYYNAFDNTNPVRFKYPFYSLIHRHQAIRDISQSASMSVKTRNEILKLIMFLDIDLGAAVKDYETMKSFETLVSFDRLWTIFQPGEIILKKDEAHFEECWEIYGIQCYIDDDDRQRSHFYIQGERVQSQKG